MNTLNESMNELRGMVFKLGVFGAAAELKKKASDTARIEKAGWMPGATDALKAGPREAVSAVPAYSVGGGLYLYAVGVQPRHFGGAYVTAAGVARRARNVLGKYYTSEKI